ncbi:Protein phosphatase 2C-like domain-containing protein 1 [Desmophyllum pertusum]|uniref:Protein phosphatase 2C-like domain-containing protein 1 n=1 Tax=Desmophyllum pertusum TaxID=174260 RepID=A0A9X0CHI0_9CNID|nr:Protein phosphatase 2C-like domain-containing protein 1 [Desmophyllum pertusum]
MADSLNCSRSKHGVVQTNRFVLRWFHLNEAPDESRVKATAATWRSHVSKMRHRSQREALRTKRNSLPSLPMGVNNRGAENKKGLAEAGNTEMQPQAAVTVNLISTRKRRNSDEEMEEIGEDLEGEEREAARGDDKEHDEPDHSDVESFDFFTESSSEISYEPILLPNILIPCTKCGDVINICRLPCHRNLHSALHTLKYSQDQRPKNINALVRRRKLLIKQQQDASSKNRQDPFGDKHLHKLNTAFEVLRIELQGNTDERYLGDRNIEGLCEQYYLERSHYLVKVLICLVPRRLQFAKKLTKDGRTWKTCTHTVTISLTNVGSAFFAIYDGYSGKYTAQKCSRHLHVFLKEELDSIITNKQVRPTKRDVTAAFRSSFSRTERLLVASEEERSQSRWSGCSAVTCVLTDDTCFIASAGNVGAILVRDNDIVKVLTDKHDLYNKKERDRVKKSSGVIVKTEKCALINGALGVTRALEASVIRP